MFSVRQDARWFMGSRCGKCGGEFTYEGCHCEMGVPHISFVCLRCSSRCTVRH